MAEATQTATATADTAGASTTTTASGTAPAAAAAPAPAAGGQAQGAAPAPAPAPAAAPGTALTDDAPGAEAKAGEPGKDGEKPAPKAPAEYAAFTLPDGVEIPGDGLDGLKALAKDLDLTQEQAQKAAEFWAQRMQTQQGQIHQAAAGWLNEAKADPEFGGDKLAENVAVAQKALAAFGNDKLKTLLKESGLGNHPEVIRFFYKAGKTISEDTFVANSSTASNTKATAAERLYPNQK